VIVFFRVERQDVLMLYFGHYHALFTFFEIFFNDEKVMVFDRIFQDDFIR